MMLEVTCSSTMFIRIVQISSLATACIGQRLFIFWSNTEQSWIFSLVIAAFNNLYRFASLYYDKFERDCSLSCA